MEQDEEAFVVAVKREMRSEVPRDWLEIVRGTPGLTVTGHANPERVQVRATRSAIEQVRSRLADYLHIESVSPRSRF